MEFRKISGERDVRMFLKDKWNNGNNKSFTHAKKRVHNPLKEHDKK